MPVGMVDDVAAVDRTGTFALAIRLSEFTRVAGADIPRERDRGRHKHSRAREPSWIGINREVAKSAKQFNQISTSYGTNSALVFATSVFALFATSRLNCLSFPWSESHPAS